jgi:AraC-like DNA-binding protein
MSIPLVSTQSLITIADVIEELAGPQARERALNTRHISSDITENRVRYIPNAELIAFMETGARLLGDKGFGLNTGRLFPFAKLGHYGRYVTGADNLASALERASRALKYHESGSSVGVEDLGDRLKLTYKCSTPSVVGANHHSDGVAQMMIDLVRLFAGSDWRPQSVDIDYEGGDHATFLEDEFQSPVQFGKGTVGLLFDKQILGSSNLHPPQLSTHFTFNDLLRMAHDRPPKTFSAVVKEMIRRELIKKAVSIEGVAASLNVGPRTMQRRLNSEGLTFRVLLDRTLLERSRELLIETDAKIAEIAMALGYSSEQHFIRAYKRWTAVTPARHRILLAS